MGRKWKQWKQGSAAAAPGRRKAGKTDRKHTVWNGMLVQWELRKLCEMPMIWVFLLLCMVFNILLIAGNRYGSEYVAYVKEARQAAGDRLGAAFDSRAAKLPESDHKQKFVGETKGAEDIFEHYNTEELVQVYLSKYRITGWAADALERKYQKQKQRVRELARQDASMDVAAAGMTEELFRFLFQGLCRAMITEGVLLAVFMALYICGSEWMARTWPAVYVSRRGRGIQKEKLAAGALCAIVAYTAIAGVSGTVFAAVWQLGDIWEADMSTQFYYIASMGLKLPFIPWITFTLRSYFMATVAMGGVVVLVFYSMGYFCGLVMKNSYAGFLSLLAFAAFNFELILITGNYGQWGLYEVVLWTPVAFWWFQPLWFSDMGVSALIPWQECAVGLLCVITSGVLLALGFRYFNHKDMR